MMHKQQYTVYGMDVLRIIAMTMILEASPNNPIKHITNCYNVKSNV